MVREESGHVYVLFLNDMRTPNIEMETPVARAETPEALEAFMLREKVDPYRDGGWGKNFRAGAPLEWFNPPFIGGGVRRCARYVYIDYSADLAAIPEVVS